MALQRLGCETAVVTSDRYFPFPDYAQSVAPILGARIVGPSTGLESGLLTYRLPIAFECRHHLWLRGLSRVIREFSPHVVHVYQSFTLPTLQAALAKPRNGYRLILRTTMEQEVFQPQDLARRAFYGFFRNAVSPILRGRVDAFTAVGRGAREVAAQVLGVPSERISLAPLGADADRFQFSSESRRTVRRELGLDDDHVLAVYAGKLIPSKDVDVLAAALARARQPQLRVLLVGNGSEVYRKQLREQTGSRSSDLLMRPAVPNGMLSQYFSAADIGVWPSESSNAAIEAALVGLPLVVSQTPATAHYVAGGNGLTFPRGDASKLGECLDSLAANAGLRGQLSANSRVYASREWTWDAIARQCLTHYEEILSAPSLDAALADPVRIP
jgi:glycosyltransferase involved in cell wall biosynthesis